MLLAFLSTLAIIISVTSLLVVTYGILVRSIALLHNEIKRLDGTYTINNIRQLRADFGTHLLLGLEFLITFDTLKTVVDPTLDESATLGGAVVVRTVLSVFLNKEIKELAKNDSAKETQHIIARLSLSKVMSFLLPDISISPTLVREIPAH